MAELDFLGHRVSADGFQPLQERVMAIREFPIPSSVCKLHEFLGLVNFYHRFIPNCASILEPLNNLLAKPQGSDHKLTWNDATMAAFTAIKETLATTTLLSHLKPYAPTCVMADASDTAVGAVLQQQIEGEWHPLSYFSKKLRPAETHYSTFDCELLSVLVNKELLSSSQRP